jgi:hypothetical protein
MARIMLRKIGFTDPISAWGNAMTVDLLAATLFWPEATVLGGLSGPPPEGDEAEGNTAEPECEDLERAKGASFWSILLRSLKGSETTAAKLS